MMRLLGLLCLCFGLIACQAPPDVQQLQADNAELQRQLQQTREQVAQLQQTQQQLEADKQELNRVMNVLGEEKSSRVEESTSLRGQVRRFVQTRIDELKRFLLNSQLVDYIGSEQVKRDSVTEKPQLVVDLANPVPADGTLTGVGGLFNSEGQLTVKVLRPVENRLLVIWESLPLSVSSSGLQRIQFSVSVGVQQGDVLAYYIATPGLVSYDKGTGKTLYTEDDINFGDSIKPSSLRGEDDALAFSLGVYGLLNTGG